MDVPDILSKELPLLSCRVRGAWQKSVIFQVIKGRQIVREYTTYDGSAKGYLIPFQSKFSAAVKSWQKLPYSSRRWFIARATKLSLQISGYNYYISLYLQDKLGGLMAYPDPHHLSHELGGLDPLDISGLVGTTPRALLGDELPGRVLRRSRIKIYNGTVAGSIGIGLVSLWNGDAIDIQDNLLPGANTDYVALHFAGGMFILKNHMFTGDVKGIAGANICKNSSGSALTVSDVLTPLGPSFAFYNAATGASVNLTTLVDTGPIEVNLLYLTSE